VGSRQTPALFLRLILPNARRGQSICVKNRASLPPAITPITATIEPGLADRQRNDRGVLAGNETVSRLTRAELRGGEHQECQRARSLR
jgi:hypothetical protein